MGAGCARTVCLACWCWYAVAMHASRRGHCLCLWNHWEARHSGLQVGAWRHCSCPGNTAHVLRPSRPMLSCPACPRLAGGMEHERAGVEGLRASTNAAGPQQAHGWRAIGAVTSAICKPGPVSSRLPLTAAPKPLPAVPPAEEELLRVVDRLVCNSSAGVQVRMSRRGSKLGDVLARCHRWAAQWHPAAQQPVGRTGRMFQFAFICPDPSCSAAWLASSQCSVPHGRSRAAGSGAAWCAEHHRSRIKSGAGVAAQLQAPGAQRGFQLGPCCAPAAAIQGSGSHKTCRGCAASLPSP